jgi:N-acyl-D-aspartate/D-glutamate deacylase
MGEFNRGISEILPPSITQPDESDRRHLVDVATASGRPVFFLVFDAQSRTWVEAATLEGAQLFALLRAIPFNPRFTLKKTTFFNNLDVWDLVMAKPFEARLATMADPDKRGELREAAMQRQRRRPGVPGRFVPWASLVISKVALPKNKALEGRKLTQLAEEQGKHVADVMLDLAVAEKLETEFQLQSRPPENDIALAEYVRSGHALPSQSDAGAHLNTNYCTAGESSWVLGQWVRDRGLLSLEDTIRRYTFQPARIMGLSDRGLVREGMAADLMVFDLASIGVKDDEVSRDGPGGTPRRVQGAEGVHHVIVNGEVVLDHGRHSGAFPGRVLRAGRR